MTKNGRSRSGRRRDEHGATFILTAICMVLLLWGGAFGVDLGFTVVGGRQSQAIADTSALDMARYINVADWNTQINNASASTTYLNGKLAYADTDNGSSDTLSETPGVWLNGSFTPEGQKVSNQTVQCWYYKPPAAHPCNAIKVTAAQSVPQIFLGGQSSATRSAIAARHAASGLLHRVVPGLLQLTAGNGPQRPPEHPRDLSERHRRGVPGTGKHRCVGQPARHRVGRAALHVQRHDDVPDRLPMARHLERCRGQPGRPAQLRFDPDPAAVLGQHRTERARLRLVETRPSCASSCRSTPRRARAAACQRPPWPRTSTCCKC